MFISERAPVCECKKSQFVVLSWKSAGGQAQGGLIQWLSRLIKDQGLFISVRCWLHLGDSGSWLSGMAASSG